FSLPAMLPAIEFDDEMRFVAHEINNISANRLLAFEFQTMKAVRTQVVPKHLLGIRHLLAQCFRVGDVLAFSHSLPLLCPLSLTLSRARERELVPAVASDTPHLSRGWRQSPAPSGRRWRAVFLCYKAALRAFRSRTRSSAPRQSHRPGTLPGR